ncbi:MAG: hypothetical protein GEV09_21185 [Pseudonocardiaceae bacterium]|nr:hypothetical protein [Pseudonocardiaceae bacterium]
MADDDRAHGVHFVGTIPLTDAEEVFRTTAELVGDRVRRLPDGETGARKDWVWIQVPILQRHPDLEQTPVEVPGVGTLTLMSPRPGVDPDALDLGDIGYAGFARESYARFRALKQQGVIAEHVRFQVDLPTPIAITSISARPDAAPAIEAAYRRALPHELDQITAHVPHDELAVQWDVCLELLMVEGHPIVAPWFDAVWDGVLERMATLGGAVPAGVELGIHLCYGDYQHERSVELDDARSLVRLANALTEAIPRPIDFLHLPVREDVDAARYLAPLADLRLASQTELYLGLITDRDGLTEALGRIAQARNHIPRFGIATECGMGRTPADVVPTLLEIHRDASAPVAPQRTAEDSSVGT